MNTHRWAGTFLLAALLLSANKAGATNVLIFMLDDLGTDKTSTYAQDYPGYAPIYLPDTRTMDSLANAGIRFTRAWGAPMCTPARVSLQTGLYPYRHEEGTALGNGAAGLDPSGFLMLAEHFTNNNYKTGFFGKWHLGTQDINGNTGVPPPGIFTDEPNPSLAGWRRFFGGYDGYPGFGRSYTDWARVSWLGGSATGYSADETAHMTDRTAEVAVNWISQQYDPWLAVVAFNAPHSADGASAPWEYGDADVTRYYTGTLSCLATQSCLNEPLSVYQGMVEHMDQEMANVLNGIPQEALDDTLIIVVGDNGTPIAVQESVFNVVGRGKGSTYENGVRIPLIVADGGTWRTGQAGLITDPGRIAQPAVGVQDIFQTISLETLLIGILGIDSSSFGQCFSNSDVYCGWTSRRYGYTEEFVAGASIVSAEIAVRYGHDKMVAYYDSGNGCLEETFYDTTTDPLETIPQTTWSNFRENRLRDHFVNLHTPHPSSWAFANGPLVPFCP